MHRLVGQHAYLAAMKRMFFQFLTGLNHVVLPKIHREGRLLGLPKWKMAVLGYKRWVAFQLMDTGNPVDLMVANQPDRFTRVRGGQARPVHTPPGSGE